MKKYLATFGVVALVIAPLACQSGGDGGTKDDEGLGGAGSGGGGNGTGGSGEEIPIPKTCDGASIDSGEQCDGAHLGDATCKSLGFDGGTLGCTKACKFDVTSCEGTGPVCGDGMVSGQEECEPGNLNGKSCESEGADGGTLGCLSTCYFDKAACRTCGNETLEDGEECDGTLLGGATCASENASFPLGDVTCSSECVIDTAACHSEDDMDADGVKAGIDPDDDEKYVCGDSDEDGCDDCTKKGTIDTANDGYDPDGDGECETALDIACIHGENAATDDNRELACVLFTLMNADRAYFTTESGNAEPLIWSEAIWEVAFAHSKDMCDRDYFSHTTKDTTKGPSDRAADAGLSFGLAENISKNWGPNATEFGFMNEPTCEGHRGNILTPRATEAAIGYYLCPTDDDVHIVTADYRWNFAIPESSYCTAASTSCEVPPEPLTTAVCRGVEVSWNLCNRTDGPTMLAEWSCPND